MKKAFFLIALLVAITSFTVNKNYFTELVTERLDTYTQTDFPEKIYIHTDKPYYSVDESVWYTTYLINGITHQKSTKSSVVYVELINDQDSILDKKQLHVDNISVAGDFKIGKKWKEGKYLIRAYTNYMRNNNVDYFFQKEISVLQTNDSIIQANKKAALKENAPKKETVLNERPEIRFFPEGGDLVAGLPSKIAFKVTDKKNRDIKLTGTIKDTDGKEYSYFNTLKFGLGEINLTPVRGKSYEACFEINGKEEKYPLPEVKNIGYTIRASNNGSSIILTANTNNNLGLKGTYLVAHQRGQIIFEKYEENIRENYTLKIPTTTISDGVIHVTLFNSSGKPVCERLVYVDNPNNHLKVDIKTDKKTYTSRKQVSLNIDVKDTAGKTATSDLSMSILDMDVIPYNTHAGNIKTWLLLNSDLRGEVRNPGYFFEVENDPRRRYLLDLVMLTHGWRRFTWEDFLYNDHKIEKHETEKGIYIKGTTVNLNAPFNRISAPTRLTFRGGTIHQEEKKSDRNGKFAYGPYVFYDSISTILEGRLYSFKSTQKSNRDLSILLDKSSGGSPKISRNTVLTNSFNDEEVTNILNASKYIQQINENFDNERRLLDEVIIKAQAKTLEEEKREQMNARTSYGEPSNRVVTDEMAASQTMTFVDLLRMMPGVLVTGDEVSIRGGGTPGFFLDGVQVDFLFLSGLTGLDIDFIDVLKGADASIYSNSSNGIIAVYSKLGQNVGSRNVKRKPGIIDFQYSGFYKAKEFFAPDHISGTDELLRADSRITLHWEPIIKVSENNKPEIKFFTSDNRSTYSVIVQGISENGTPVYGFSTFNVK